MKSLMIMATSPNEVVFVLEKQHIADILRVDLAWPLFLSKKGFDSNGHADIPQGNPRSQWFSLNQWFRQSMGTVIDSLTQSEQNLMALLPPCTPAALEYVSRMLSIYSGELGLLDLSLAHISPEDVASQAEYFFSGHSTKMVKDAWIPPVMHLEGEETPLQQKMGKNQNGNSFTWVTGILGSDRLFSQVYRLAAGTSGNRLHSHSDVDEMYVVLKGKGELVTNNGRYLIQQGDVIGKPSGSGLCTQFFAGEEGMTLLDIEAWTRSDQTDIVGYPEHGEILLRGRGIHHGVAFEHLFSGSEIMLHYADDKREKK